MLTATVSLAVSSSPIFAQQTIIGKGKNFSISPDFYDSPHESQMKSLLRGKEVEPQSSERILVRGGWLQTYREDGVRELLVEAPECIYESTQRAVHSAGPLTAQTADGKFALSGRGFSWHQTNSILIISNQVHTYVHPALLRHESGSAPGETTTAKPNEGLVITSDSFHYNERTGTGIYRDNVRVSGTNLAMNSGVLTIQMPTTTRQLESIAAEQSVVIDYADAHATGSQVLYSAKSGLVTVTGKPAWQTPGREGRADHVVIDPTNRVVKATGNSWIKISEQSVGASTLLGDAANARHSTPPFGSYVIVRSAECEVRTNQAWFSQNVEVEEHRPGQPGGRMRCEEMWVTYTGTNQVERLVAERQVEIVQEDKKLTAAKAIYTATNQVLELTGDPQWEYGQRQGKGSLIQVNTTAGELCVQGNASMRLPAEEFGQLAAGTSPATGVTLSTNAQTGVCEVFSEEYRFSKSLARFKGGVYISHPRMNWACEDLSVHLPEAGGPVRRILADQSVVFDLIDDKGQKIHGTSGRAVYVYEVQNSVTNDYVELSGDPVLERRDLQTGNPIILRNQVLILDRGRNQVLAPGQFNVQGWGRIAETNVLGQGKGGLFK